MSRLERSVKILAWLELAFSVMQILTGIYALVVVSQTIKDSFKNSKPEVKPMVNFVAIIAIKFVYLAFLFIISEICLTLFLLRSVYQKNAEHLRIWLIVGLAYAALYFTDFVSTLHVMSLFENISVTLGIFIKIPLLILVWRFHLELSNNGENLINEV